MRNNILITKLKAEIENGEAHNDVVSKASVYWHLDHILKVYNGVCNLLLNSNEVFYKPKFSFFGWWFITFNYLPRGKGRAPKGTYTKVEITTDQLKQQYKTAENNLSLLQKANENLFFSHPYFGDINKAKTLKFLYIHTQHHLKIINDIRKVN